MYGEKDIYESYDKNYLKNITINKLFVVNNTFMINNVFTKQIYVKLP